MGNLYDDDILLWSEQQAELLRRLARGERVNDALDFEHLIDEVECVGRSEFQAVESLLDVALTHLMAAHAAGRPEPVPHWLAEVRAALARAARRATPSMLPRLDLQDLWALARDSAADKLAADGGPARPLPQTCPFTAAELLNRKPDVDALLARLAAARPGPGLPRAAGRRTLRPKPPEEAMPDTHAAAAARPTGPPGPVGGPGAWTGPDMARRTGEWLHILTDAELAEIETAIRAHKAAGRAMGEITAETFRLPTFGPRLAAVLEDLLHGPGFAVLRGLPVERLGTEDSAIGYLGIGAHFGSFRSQNARGHLLGHVKDIGLDIRDPKVRYYQTTRALEYHTDSCDLVGLLCLKTAKAGGESRIVSSVTLHDEILRRRPDLAGALFHAFPTDRRGEVPPGMLPWFEVPVFSWHEGRLTAIYSGQYIRSAQANFPEARRLTPAETEALALLDELANDPALNLQIEFCPGDMQFLHNHQILHSRTDFENWPEPERHRHLLRLWLAPRAGRPLPPAFAQRYGGLTPGDRGGIVVKDTVLTFTLEPA